MPIFLHAQVNMTQGLQLYLPFNGNANDASGNNNNGTIYNAVLTQDQNGNPNSAYYFNGIDAHIDIPDNVTLNPVPGTGFSVCAKVKMLGFYNGFCYNNTILSKGSDLASSSYQYYSLLTTQTIMDDCNFQDTTHHNYRFDYNGNGNATATQLNALLSNPPYVQTNQWDCLVGIFYGDTSYMYVNGTLRYKLATIFKPGNTSDLSIGYNNYNSFYPFWFKGVIDEVRIYNRALNMDEIDYYCTNKFPEAVNNIENKKSFNIYPNPATNEIFIECNFSNVKLKGYSICDMQGKIFKQEQNLNTQKIQINMDNFSKGLYLIKIQDDKGNYYTDKIMME